MKFHWWYIPLGLIILLLAAFSALILWMHSMLPWENMVSMTSNFHLALSEKMKDYATGGQRDYTSLPEVLEMEDGTAVTTPEDFSRRREEILGLFEAHVYGAMPNDGFTTDFTVVEEGEALGGAAWRKQVKITVSTQKGSSDALMLMYLPVSQSPVPVVLGLNFNGNHSVLDDPAILPSYANELDSQELEADRGAKAERWAIQDAISRGYGIATVYCNDFAPDSSKTYRSRVISLFDEPEFKAVGAWAFGIMRGVDYLVQNESVDASRIADIGHSRLGKAALWAGANDTRIALVISNDSGNTGASLTRENKGETMKSINSIFPHWFCSQYQAYGDDTDALPVDQHMLLACIAPRQVYVANAEDDLWADPQGAWNALMASRSAFELYGLEVLPYAQSQPAIGQAMHCQSMGYHCRAGWHDVQKEDWAFYFQYMDEFLIPQ